jgi:hypothetical protein
MADTDLPNGYGALNRAPLAVSGVVEFEDEMSRGYFRRVANG